jgi:hypothetical protein
MSTQLSRRGRVLLIAGAAAGLVAIPAVASAADPPGIDPPSCARTLADVTGWPGVIPIAGGQMTVFSDAFYSHLARSAECGGTS